jgi:hypothetical protein
MGWTKSMEVCLCIVGNSLYFGKYKVYEEIVSSCNTTIVWIRVVSYNTIKAREIKCMITYFKNICLIFDSQIIEIAAYFNQIFQVPLYLDRTQKHIVWLSHSVIGITFMSAQSDPFTRQTLKAHKHKFQEPFFKNVIHFFANQV